MHVNLAFNDVEHELEGDTKSKYGDKDEDDHGKFLEIEMEMIVIMWN